MQVSTTFKQRLADGEMLVGAFVKTPSPIVVEVLSLTALDCLCLDAEHAPFDRPALDLDCGATGVVVPHVRSAAEASAAVRASHYGPGGRGYAGSSRAAGYTTRSMLTHKAASAERTVVVIQIEDPEAIDDIEAIAQVEGVDAMFVGRADLTVAYGADSQDDPRVIAAVDAVCDAGRRWNRPVGMFLARVEDAPAWREKGASLFLLSSDHSFLLAGAADLLVRSGRT